MKDINEYLKQLESGKMSRRDFVKALMALGLSVPAIDVILTKSGSKAWASTPVKGGRLVLAERVHGPADTLDPAIGNPIIDGIRAHSICNQLVARSKRLEPIPELAESWTPKKTADEWTFKLRKGVEFHDGRSFTADDVVYTFKRVLDPQTGSPGRPLLLNIEDIRALDPHTVVFKLKAADADFPILLGNRFSLILPAGHTDFDHAIGTGPFRLKTFKPGIRCIVERNPNYWKTGLPYLDEIETFAIGDPVARLNALLAGNVQLITSVHMPAMKKIKETAGIKLWNQPSCRFLAFSMDTAIPPYTDNNVRQAMKYLVDREKYVEIVYKGFATIANDHPVAPMHSDYCEELPIRPYDPDQAKFLLKKAGALDYTHELFTMEGYAGMMDGALFYAQSSGKAGVKVEVVRAPADGYWDHTWGKKPFFGTEYSPRPAASQILSLIYLSDAPWNATHWIRPKFDKLLLEAKGCLDPKRRKSIYCEIQRMVSEDGGHIIPGFTNEVYASSDKLHVELHPIVPIVTCFLEETGWIET